MMINRGKCGESDVRFEMLFCGICHSDIHLADNHIGGTMYPIVAGHELIGKVTEVGAKVTKFVVGDNVGVGCMVDSCRNCKYCEEGEEIYCATGSVYTYNGKKMYKGVGGNPDTQTFGGYSGSNVVDEHFVFKIPDGIPLEKAAPILCAGITLYDPMRHWNFTNGNSRSVGIVGVGGLGTMGIKIAKALGHTVYAISTSVNKKDLAIKKGADHFVVSKDEESMKAATGKMDLILNTVSADHDLNVYLPLLATNGLIVQLGAALAPHPIV